jgi:hypothetical protein
MKILLSKSINGRDSFIIYSQPSISTGSVAMESATMEIQHRSKLLWGKGEGLPLYQACTYYLPLFPKQHSIATIHIPFTLY